ncbi:MAG: histidine decarboxylase [Acaryochloridaceae cyanobacterium SU_2_1]|nr:histidine decarboxylase [Acaryochloridaceae cyanobacterium SU_2_1]
MRSQWLFESSLSAADQSRLDQFFADVAEESKSFLGYPCNGLFDYSPLFKFLQYPLNNVGDPFLPSNYHLNTHEFECDLLKIFQTLTQAPENQTWGYITNGGTEGNHYGLFLARELMPKAIVYYSQDAHYSIDKILRCLGMRSIMIRSLPKGAMDLDDLRETLRIHRDLPAIVCATVGTTMKGAVDDILGIQNIFQELALKRHYLHVDAALGGMVMPFLADPPPWNFEAGIDSIAISGHKMIGSPIPCGVVLAKKSYVDRIAQSVEYIGTLDTTLSGSRNAFTPLVLWYALHSIGLDRFQQMVKGCLETADYAIDQLTQLDRNAWRHPYANIVVFDRPASIITQRWQLACQGDISHLITMPHVTKEQLDNFIASLQALETLPDRPVMPLSVCETTLSDTDQNITIISSDAINLLTQVSTALAAAGLSIEDLFAVKTQGGSIVHMKVDNREKALQILNLHLDIGRCHGHSRPFSSEETAQILSQVNYHAVSDEALLIQLQDRPGSLAQVMKQCQDHNIAIRAVRLISRSQGEALVEIASDQAPQLKAIFSDRILHSNPAKLPEHQV